MKVSVAVWQMAPTMGEPTTNLARLDKAAHEAVARGADVLVTPELALTGYDVGELSDDLTDPALLQDVAAIAQRAGLAIVAGLALREDGATCNCSVIADRTGDIRAVYRKAHLYGDLDRSRFTAGEAPFAKATLDIGLEVATMVCYDVEFPEPVRAAALAGAELIAVPTANMPPSTEINDYVVPARAVENHVVVAYANHCGRERDTEYVGRSVIATPDGTTRMAGADGEGIEVLTFDTDELEERRRSRHLVDRRPEIYGAVVEPGAP